MTNHPITPSPEIVDQLFMIEGLEEDRIIAAYRAGADQELEAMLAELKALHLPDGYAARLRAVRRPKPPSLKEQALAVIENAAICDHLSFEDEAIIRRALEQLDD
jgi:hypothetical protein